MIISPLGTMDFKEIKVYCMEQAEQHIQNEYIRNAPKLLNWNDIRNADMNELYEIMGEILIKRMGIGHYEKSV